MDMRKRILLVEDSKEFAEMVEETLEELCIVVKVTSVLGAKNFLRNVRNLDLIICDKQLSDGEGFEVLEFYHEMGGTAPVLFLSGESDVDDKIEGFRMNVLDYLEKPISMRELRTRVVRILNP